RLEVELENLLAPRAQQREEPMRRDLRERLGVAEVIGILRTLGLLAFDDLRADHAAAPQPFAQPAEKLRVLAPALDQDRARAFERGLRVGHALLLVDEFRRGLLGRAARILEQQVRERLETRLARDLRPGPALRPIGQVKVLEPRLAVRGLDVRAQRVGQLALLLDAREDRPAAILELAQIREARLERAQLRVVQAARDLLPIA